MRPCIAYSPFEYARVHGRKKVTAFSKDNIMEMTDEMASTCSCTPAAGAR